MSLDREAQGLTPDQVADVRDIVRATSAGLMPDLAALVTAEPLEVPRIARDRLAGV